MMLKDEFATSMSCIPDRLSNWNNEVNLNSVFISRNYIFNKIKNLDIFKETGPDYVPPSLLKLCGYSFIEPLFILFSQYLQSSVFPYE